jgi:hypothetical protein
MINLHAARDVIANVDSQAQVVSLGEIGRDAVQFRAFNTDAFLTITKPDAEALCGCVIFAEVQDARLNLASVNDMNRTINFGSVRHYEPDVAIVSSGQLFPPDAPDTDLEHLLTAWSDTIDQFWGHLRALPQA